MNFDIDELKTIYNGLNEAARFYREHAIRVSNYDSGIMNKSEVAKIFTTKAEKCETILARLKQTMGFGR